MKNVRPLGAARRKVERLRKLLSDQGDVPVCLFCGCSEPMLLRPITRRFVRRHRRLFEEHHVFGRKLDGITVLALCLNCHALVTEGFLRAGVLMQAESNPIKFAGAIFRALAVHNRMLSDACWRFSKRLDEKRKHGPQNVQKRRILPKSRCRTQTKKGARKHVR